jgi:small subunit ribosomal protein S4e
MSRHLKRLNAPKSWTILRKTTKYIVKPLPGAHKLSESMPISLVLRQLGHAQSAAEAKKILHAHKILVDGRRVIDLKSPVGLFDSITLAGSNEYYRIVFDTKGRLQFLAIPKNEAGLKICKIINKTSIPGGRIQLNLNDGRNIIADKNPAKTGDTLVIEVPSQKIANHLVFEKGALIYLLGGKHIGTIGVLDKVDGDEITVTQDSQPITTAKKYALVVGKDKPILTILKKA